MAVRRAATRVTRRRRAARRAAVTPRAPKRRVTRRSARKVVTPRAPKRRTARRSVARRAATPKAPKRRRTARRTTRRAAKRVTRRRTVAKKPRKPKTIIGSMRRVFNGTADKTKGGLRKSDLMMNKRGKVVSKKMNAKAKKQFKKSGLGKWVAACQKARAELGLTGFVACKKGTAYYNLAKQYYN